MTPEDRHILGLFADVVRRIEPRARIWAFGSRARGSASQDSDFDIGIVLPSAEPATLRAINNLAWEIGFEHERILTTVIFTEDEFERGPLSASPLVAHIRSEGVAA